MPDLDELVAAGDLLEDGLVALEVVAALVDVAELHGVADDDAPAVGRLLADDHPEQRRLAGSVGADDADDPGLRQRERQAIDQDLVAVRLAQVLDLDDGVAEAGTGRDGDLELAGLVLGVVGLGQQLLVGAESGLALRLSGLRAQAHPFELARQGALPRVDGLLLAAHALQLLLEPARVVALERDPATAVELEDPLGDVVEEVAVVGDRHDGARVLLEEALEPVDRLGVEVVGRLVEQQQVGVAEQQRRGPRGASRRRRSS